MSRARNLRRRRPSSPVAGLYRLAEGEEVVSSQYGAATHRRAVLDAIRAREERQPAPPTAWQQVKLRQAMGQALLLARWGLVRR